MEKRNLYVIIAVVLIIGLALSFSNLTGRYLNPNKQIGQCIDSDGGDNPEKPGIVRYTVASTVYKDVCYAEAGVGVKEYVKERYCFGGRMQNRVYLCLSGCTDNHLGEGYCNEGEVNRINTQT